MSTPKFKADTIEFSSKVSFKGNLALNLKAMMYARQADKILSQAKQVRLSQYEVIEDAQELQKEAGRRSDRSDRHRRSHGGSIRSIR